MTAEWDKSAALLTKHLQVVLSGRRTLECDTSHGWLLRPPDHNPVAGHGQTLSQLIERFYADRARQHERSNRK